MLLDYYAHKCVKLEQAREADGEGGWTVEWKDGDFFSAYRVSASSSETEKAEQAAANDTYRVMVGRPAPLAFGDYYRESDTGETFRVISATDSTYSPDASSVPVNAFTVERRDLPV